MALWSAKLSKLVILQIRLLILLNIEPTLCRFVNYITQHECLDTIHTFFSKLTVFVFWRS